MGRRSGGCSELNTFKPWPKLASARSSMPVIVVLLYGSVPQSCLPLSRGLSCKTTFNRELWTFNSPLYSMPFPLPTARAQTSVRSLRKLDCGRSREEGSGEAVRT